MSANDPQLKGGYCFCAIKKSLKWSGWLRDNFIKAKLQLLFLRLT